jgi:hypothetical protein
LEQIEKCASLRISLQSVVLPRNLIVLVNSGFPGIDALESLVFENGSIIEQTALFPLPRLVCKSHISFLESAADRKVGLRRYVSQRCRTSEFSQNDQQPFRFIGVRRVSSFAVR